MKARTYHLFVSAWLRGSQGDGLYFFGRDKTQSTIELQISRQAPSNSAANSLSLFAVTLDQRNPHFFFFPDPPLQLHLSSLTEKVWNRLKVGLRNKKLWHVVKPVWDTHTQWAQKGKLKAIKRIL